MSSKKTIVIFSAFYAPFASGAERFVEEVGNRLADRFHVVVITSRLASRLPRRERLDGMEIVRVGFGTSWDKFLFPLLAPLAAWRMAPVLVHAVMESYAGIALLLYRLIAPRIPTMLTLQSGDLDAPEKRSKIPQWLWQRIHTAPHQITAISRFLAARAERLGVPSGRVRVIPNGADLVLARTFAGVSKVPGRIVCVGRLSWEKGQLFLIEALPHILRERPEAHLVLVGDGAERESLERLVDERGLRDRVRFTGTLPREEALRELSQASVAALPSLGEGLGIAAIEAQAVGVPIVASNVGGIPDVVTDEETGLLVPPRNSAALASAILRLMRQPELPARLAAAAREQLPRFDWDKIAHDVGELYEILIPKTVDVSGPAVLIATGIYPPDIGGPAKYAETLLEELPKRGVRPLVLTYGEDGDDASHGIYRVSRAFPPIVRHKLYAWRVWRLGRRVQAIIVLDTISAGLPAVLANVFLKKRLVVKVVGDYAWEQGQGRFGVRDSLDEFQTKRYGLAIEILRALQRFVVRRADIVFAPSNYLAGIVRGWGSKDVRVVYNAVPVFHAGVGSAPRFPGKDVILSAGRMVPWKGFATLIGLIPELLKHNSKFHLAILGDGPERPKLEELVRDLHVEESVTLVGRVSHTAVGEYLREANIFVLNSGYEGFSHVLLEAMVADVPIAASTAGGNRELLEASGSTKAGLGFAYNNREEIKSAIIALTSDEALRRSCVETAREKVAQFTVAAMIDGALTLLLPEREILNARVLMVSLDSTILDTDSPSFRRMVAYASAVENLTVLVLAPGAPMEKLAAKLRVVRAGGITKIDAFFRTFLRMGELVREQPHVVEAQDPFFAGLIAALVSRRARARLCIQLHGDFWTDNPTLHPGALRRLAARFVLGRADRIRVVSNRVRRGLLREFSSLMRKGIHVFPIVSGESLWNPDGAVDAGIVGQYTPGSTKVLFVGRLVREKGLDWFLPVFAKVAQEMPLHLRILGEGAEKENLQKLVKKLGIAERVTFTKTETHNLPNEYSTADFLVLPSRQESWGRVVVEALQCDRAVLTTREVGCAEDLLEDGVSALIAPFGDDTAMYDRLRRMATDEALRKRLAEAGQAAVSHLNFRRTVSEVSHFWSGIRD